MEVFIPQYDDVDEQLVELVDPQFALRWDGEFRWGRRLLKARALERQRALAKENYNARHRGINGVGQNQFRCDRTLYHILASEAGYDAMEDEGHRARLIRDNPDLCFKPTYQPPARIIHPGFAA